MSQSTGRRIRYLIFCLGLIPVAGFTAMAGGVANECVGFFEETVASGGISGAEGIFAADMDGDNDIDLISASSVDDSITWYENDPARTPRFIPRVITRTADSAARVHAVDLDGDGDMDILAAVRGAGNVTWYVNNGATPPVFISRTVSADVPVATDVTAADIDGVNGIDVLSTSFVNNRVIWHRSNGSLPRTFSASTVSSNARGASSVAVADLDDDGDLDVISASVLDDKIAWYEAEPDAELASGIAFTEHDPISDSADGANFVVAADIDQDPDGDIDVVAASFLDDTIRWFQNNLRNVDPKSEDPQDEFLEQIISTSAAGVVSLAVADLDEDGRPDVIAALSGTEEIVWYRNEGPPSPGEVPAFAAAEVISALAPGANDVVVADIDGADKIDVASVSSIEGFPSTKDKVAWHANTPGGFVEEVIAVSSEGADDVAVADMDDDLDVDIVVASAVSGMLSWFENDGGVFTKNTVATDQFGVRAIALADMDGDLAALTDVVAAIKDTATIAWFENSGDSAVPFAKQNITDTLTDARAVFLSDLDGDMDPDVLAAGSGAVAVYDNQGASAFVESVLDTEGEGAAKVLVADVDGDGALDVVTASTEDASINWYSGDGAQTPAFPVFTKAENPISVIATDVQTLAAGDLDGDGIDDIVAGISGISQINWYKIDDDDDDPDTPSVFVSRGISSANGPRDLLVEDVDGDLDLDLVTLDGTARLSWFENLREEADEIPVFQEHVIIGDRNGPTSVALGKLNGDDQLDIAVGLAFEVLWYEEIDEICGQFDVDGDSRIDGTELSWLGRAFGETLATPGPWWEAIDLNDDGVVDGEDLSILTSIGVWGRETDTCIYTCR